MSDTYISFLRLFLRTKAKAKKYLRGMASHQSFLFTFLIGEKLNERSHEVYRECRC